MNTKVLITEDHELYRDGLRRLVLEAIADADVIEAADFPSTEAALNNHPDLDLVLFDIHIPGTRGLEGLSTIKQQHPALPLIVVSTVDQHISVRQMVQLGADGFIAKSSSKATMIKALRDIMAGETVIVGEQDNAAAVELSPRQLATLELLAQGLPNKEIAAQLHLSPATVREYVSDILARFDCDNRIQAVIKARELGFILD